MTIIESIPVLDWATAPEAERNRVLRRGDSPGPLTLPTALRENIADLIEDVRKRGDDALVDALRRFDGVDVTSSELRVSRSETDHACAVLSPAVKEAIRVSIAQVRAFNEIVRERHFWSAERDGVRIGETAAPMRRVGLFVPSGKGSFPSVLVQIAVPAVVAGVEEIVVMVPPTPGTGGAIDPAVLFAAAELGITEVYRCNGPAGIGALAHGTATIARVDKIVGPGSPAVVAAQLEAQRAGCLIEVGYGPSDSLIISDAGADPGLLAADLLNEAEHGADSSAVLIGLDAAVLAAAATEVVRQLQELPEPRRGYAWTSITRNGGIIRVDTIAQAIAIANNYAPEHVQLAVADPDRHVSAMAHAGTILLGQWTPFAASNFAIGTPATLPTSGFARTCSGVTAATYLTRTAVAGLTRQAFERLAPTITAFAVHEGFPAHAATVTARAGVTA
ncbi:histidinol dehydrogenase [Actinoplanes sp. NPDC048791]|uniref:histidinol dehydrogenase n=1 Tax=Actinoplanes sp. NPDC048791 TaxID=3154623 RepID=UPI0033D85103